MIPPERFWSVPSTSAQKWPSSEREILFRFFLCFPAHQVIKIRTYQTPLHPEIEKLNQWRAVSKLEISFVKVESLISWGSEFDQFGLFDAPPISQLCRFSFLISINRVKGGRRALWPRSRNAGREISAKNIFRSWPRATPLLRLAPILLLFVAFWLF